MYKVFLPLIHKEYVEMLLELAARVFGLLRRSEAGRLAGRVQQSSREKAAVSNGFERFEVIGVERM